MCCNRPDTSEFLKVIADSSDHLRRIISLRGDDNADWELSSSQSRSTWISHIQQLIDDGTIDGIEIDWQPSSTLEMKKHRDNFLQFVKVKNRSLIQTFYLNQNQLF